MDKNNDQQASMKKIKKRSFQGVVVSDAMDKTIVVEVKRRKAHSVYGRQYAISRRYKVHDPKNAYKVGQVVECEETRPISKEKHWKVKEIKDKTV